jgi:RNA polymerase sigma-70 factor, ECF subfamily
MKTEEPSDGPGLLERALRGDAEAIRALFSGQRERLKRLVRLRLSRELTGRVDESEVVDQILKEATERLADYAGQGARPLSLWIRQLGCRKLAELQVHHSGSAGVARRGAAVGVLTLHASGLPIVDVERLAARIHGEAVGPDAADRAGRRVYVQEAINSLELIDRELIALKHFERLAFGEIAQVLGLTEAEAGRRYLGAIRRLREVLPWYGGSGRS